MSSVTFESKFIKEKTTTGKYIYHFPIVTTDVSIEGSLLTQDIPPEKLREIVWNFPEECKSKDTVSSIMTQWNSQCSSCFTKPPPLDICVTNTICQIDPASKSPFITTEEELNEWFITWSPTKLLIDTPKFILYWGPIGKKENTRISEEFVFETGFDEQTEPHTIMQEPVESTIGVSELNPEPAAIVESDNFRRNPSIKKDIDRVAGAYEKARHAYEKAEHYNQKFYKKYGFYAVDEDGSETSSFQTDGWLTDYDDAE